MAKLNPPAKPPLEKTTTFEGGEARQLKPETALLLTGASTYLGERSFYETPGERADRLRRLTRQVTNSNPYRVAEVVKSLRLAYNIRTAPIVIAAEMAANLAHFDYDGKPEKWGPVVAETIQSACGRADEPMEFLAYWFENHGRSLPSPVKKGLARACVQKFNQHSALKWDSAQRAVRMGDVIELTHPTPRDGDQSALFKFLLDQRHHKDGFKMRGLTALSVLHNHHILANTPENERRTILRSNGPKSLADAGFTWERLSSWLPDGMDAEAWESVIPSMGVMALLRNLRNFDAAGISVDAINVVLASITDPASVRNSRIFPYRVLAAKNNTHSDNWGRGLNRCLELAAENVPRLDRTLILVDLSGSMNAAMSDRSQIRLNELASLMAASVAMHSTNTDVVGFGSYSARVYKTPGQSVMNFADDIRASASGGTYGHTAMAAHWNPEKYDKVLVFTDGQFHDDPDLTKHIPFVLTFDLAGYHARPMWGGNRPVVGGFSDQVFRLATDILM